MQNNLRSSNTSKELPASGSRSECVPPFDLSDCDCTPGSDCVDTNCQPPRNLGIDDQEEDKDCVPPNNKDEKYVYLELTSACNNKCPGCLNESFIADFSNRRIMPEFHKPVLHAAEWMKILNRLPTKIGKVMLSGGEPTLYSEFFSLTRELNKNNFRFAVFSNGRWKNASRLLTHLKELPRFRGFLISLHGSTAVSHDNFTGVGGSFEETIRGIRAAIRVSLPVTLSTVITSDNYTEIDQIVSLAQFLGVRSIAFNRYCYTPKRTEAYGQGIHYPNYLQLRSAIQNIERRRDNSPLRITYGPTIPQCFEPSASQACAAGTGSFALDPWGNLKPCLHVDFTAGNLANQDFNDVWNNQIMQSWRGPMDDSCATCSALSQCGGGCRAMAIAWGGKDPLMTVQVRAELQLPILNQA